MRILSNVEEIFAKYDLKPIEVPTGFRSVYDYLRANPLEREKFESEKNDSYFLKKYCDYIPKGWYGFDIGTPIVPEWMEIIDEIVEICTEIDPDFEIHQIKLKFGAICFYVHSSNIEDIHDVEILIMNNLFDRALIY
jgi:hypothetical protein